MGCDRVMRGICKCNFFLKKSLMWTTVSNCDLWMPVKFDRWFQRRCLFLCKGIFLRLFREQASVWPGITIKICLWNWMSNKIIQKIFGSCTKNNTINTLGAKRFDKKKIKLVWTIMSNKVIPVKFDKNFQRRGMFYM